MTHLNEMASDVFDDAFSGLSSFVDDRQAGWTREVFSEPYRESRTFIAERMREAGLEVNMDGAGNILGRLAGTASRHGTSLKPIMTGSHTDTVKNGGRFDGIVGVLGAIEAVHLLRERGVELQRDLYIVDFLGEEPNEFGVSCIGSRSLSGLLLPEHMDVTGTSGQTLGTTMSKFGLDTEAALRHPWGPGSLHAYIELHIEQAPTLEREGKQIGVVTAIAGIDRLMARFVGEAAHAGATPMSDRHDALASAAEAILTIEREGCGAPVHGVATAGRIESEPGSFNVVPSEARVYAELRSIDAEWLNGAKRNLTEQIAQQAQTRGVTQMIEWLTDQDPVATTPVMRDHIAAASDSLGLSWMSVPSGAGHDAAHMAHLGPMGMIFVPSVDGHSHRPDEFTKSEDVQAGVQTLTEVLVRLDRESLVR